MLSGQWLKVEPVRGIVVGGDGLWVTVDHNHFVARIAQRIGGMDAAIVELNPLADAVWAAAEHHDFLRLAGVGFAFCLSAALALMRAVKIGRTAVELARTGVNAFIDRRQRGRRGTA